MLNSVILQGRFVETPELKITQSGKQVTSFRFAVPRDYKRNGEEITDFFRCVAWGSTAEFITKYFEKGTLAVLQGSIEDRSYEDKNGNKRSEAEIKINNMYFSEAKKRGANNGVDPDATFSAASPDFREIPDIEDDLPF